jgi:hypothetical protein
VLSLFGAGSGGTAANTAPTSDEASPLATVNHPAWRNLFTVASLLAPRAQGADDPSATPGGSPLGQALDYYLGATPPLQPLQLPSINLQPSIIPSSPQPQADPLAWLRAFSTPRS